MKRRSPVPIPVIDGIILAVLAIMGASPLAFVVGLVADRTTLYLGWLAAAAVLWLLLWRAWHEDETLADLDAVTGDVPMRERLN